MQEIKIRLVCEDVAGNIFYRYKTLDELLHGNYSIDNDGLIERILSKDLFAGLKDKKKQEVYENDVLEIDKILSDKYPFPFTPSLGGCDYGIVVIDKGAWSLRFPGSGEPNRLLYEVCDKYEFEIMGDIHTKISFDPPETFFKEFRKDYFADFKDVPDVITMLLTCRKESFILKEGGKHDD